MLKGEEEDDLVILFPFYSEEDEFKMKYAVSVLALMILLLGLGSPSYAQSDGSASPANTFTLSVKESQGNIQVIVKGVNLVDVFAYDLQFTYDSARLKLIDSRSEGSGFSVEPIVDGGRIRLAHTKIGSVAGTNGDADLATLLFQRIGAGAAELSLAEVKLVNSKLEMTAYPVDIRESIQVGQMTSMFTDIKNHWAEMNILGAAARGFINGYGDGTFKPDRQVSRAEFASMLVRALSLPAAVHPGFSDLEKIPAWARPYAASAEAAGLLTGYEDRSFRADLLITREQAMVMIARAMEKTGLKGQLPVQSPAAALLPYTDKSKVSSWAESGITDCLQAGIVSGRSGTILAPKENLTRAEAAVIVQRLLQKSGL